MEQDLELLNYIDVSGTIYIDGNEELFRTDDKRDYETSIILALPFGQDFKEGDFKVNYEEHTIKVQISKIVNKDDDLIFNSVENLTPIVNIGPEPFLIPEMYTDNRGRYPYYCAKIRFPYLLADWFDPTTMTGLKHIDYEKAQITGGYKFESKIEALVVLNKLSSSQDIGLKKPLVYEDVTLFIENYFLNKYHESVLQRIITFASNSAFKDSIKYFLGVDGYNYISDIVKKQSDPIHYNIQTEADLLALVMDIINEDIIHNIENRRLTQAFWDGSRKIKIEDKEVPVPQEPKSEVNIQPTLYFLLQLSLKSLGIHVVRETDEGIGHLDFKFLYTTSDHKALSICLEFKLAHHKKIKHGLTKQLPAYIKAERSTCGIFAIMWFKDEKGEYFKEPSDRTKEEMIEFIEKEAKLLQEKEGLDIKTFIIDASIKPSASYI